MHPSAQTPGQLFTQPLAPPSAKTPTQTSTQTLAQPTPRPAAQAQRQQNAQPTQPLPRSLYATTSHTATRPPPGPRLTPTRTAESMPYLNLNDEVGERPEYDAWRETDATRRYPPDMPLCPATLLEVTQRIPNFTAETRQLGKHSRTYEGAMPREPNEAPTTEMRKRRRVIADVSGELHGNVAEDYPLEPAPRAPPYHPMEVDEDEEEFTPHLPEGDEGPNDTYRMQYCYGVNPRSLTQAHMPPTSPTDRCTDAKRQRTETKKTG